jgi:glucose/arabinose dehydrogenase
VRTGVLIGLVTTLLAGAGLVVTTGAGCTATIRAVTQIAADTDVPWGLTQLPDGAVLYSRRDVFDIVRLDPATGVKTSIGRVPGTQGTDGEGGVMAIAVAATFDTDPWIYIMHTSATDNRVVRIRYTGGVLSGIARNKFHNGGRLRFGPGGKLYVATGDGQNGERTSAGGTFGLFSIRLHVPGSPH